MAVLSGACLAVAGVAGCNNFITGEGLTTDPNRPTSASADQLFVGVQVQTFAQFTGQYPLQLLPLFARQFAGVARQWANYAIYSGTPNENDADAAFSATYGAGGLADIRQIEAATRASGNLRFLGIAQVYEALRIGTAADLWGDVPYSQALQAGKPPKLDPQAQVYAAVQTVLDSAITNLASGKGAGPTAVDFVFGNDPQKWIAAAHTLKARFYMHTSRGPDSVAVFRKVIQEAQQGISDPANDWVAQFTSTTGEQNLYYNFLNSRQGDIEPDSVLIAILNSRNDQQLLRQYFLPDTSQRCGGGSVFVGSTPTQSAPCVSAFNIKKDTPVPMVTAAENEMLLAEAQYRTGQAAQALATLNAFRAKVGYPPVVASGVAILMAILQEKYVRLYLNPEAYFDYLRTCYPNFQVSYAQTPGVAYVPARFPYGYSERITNPNIPDPGSQPLANANFPKNRTDPTGAVCYGQANRPGP